MNRTPIDTFNIAKWMQSQMALIQRMPNNIPQFKWIHSKQRHQYLPANTILWLITHPDQLIKCALNLLEWKRKIPIDIYYHVYDDVGICISITHSCFILDLLHSIFVLFVLFVVVVSSWDFHFLPPVNSAQFLSIAFAVGASETFLFLVQLALPTISPENLMDWARNPLIELFPFKLRILNSLRKPCVRSFWLGKNRYENVLLSC